MLHRYLIRPLLSTRRFGLASARKPYSTISLNAEEDDIHRIPPQLDYKYLATHADSIQQNMVNRNYDSDNAQKVKQLYTEQERLKSQQAEMTAERDRTNQAIREAKSKADRTQYIERGKQLKDQLRSIEQELSQVYLQLESHALLIPNDTHPAVPVGAEENATRLKVIGSPRKEDGLLDHLTLAERLGLVDFSQAAKVSGSKFYYLKGAGAWLEMALVQYALTKASERNFCPVITPDVVRTSVAYGCGFQPRKKEASQIYDVSTPSMPASAPKLCLAGTAEIPLAGMFAQQMLNEDQLPQRVVGFGRAFRAEAGHGSAETRGLYRVHQFSKVELFVVSTPAQSDAILEELRELQEEIFTELGLCFRVLDMPTEELGASAYRKYDMEAWLPGRQTWGEISSTSNCTDYQSRRLDIRYVDSAFKEHAGAKEVRVPWHVKEKYVHFAHTLNGTAIAVPRTLVALLETYQRPDGTVEIPDVLRKWLPGNMKYLS